MNLREIPPEDVIEPSWLDSYEKNIEAIWWQLVRLNSTIFVLEKLLAFRFDLFATWPNHFWSLLEHSLVESCVMTIWRVAIDSSYTEGLTVRQLKNDILKNLQKDEYIDEFRNLLKSVDFEQTVGRMEPKIIEIRHNYVAHFHLGKHVKPPPEEVLLLSELQRFQDALNSLFEVLCFGHGRAILPTEYHPEVVLPPDLDKLSDVERVLDSVVRDSELLNLPEKNPAYWPIFRDTLQAQDIRILNEYRSKFGLPEV